MLYWPMPEISGMNMLSYKWFSRRRFSIRPGSPAMIILTLLFFLQVSGAARSAFAGPIEIQSIQIVPSETTVGRHPDITGSIKATRELAQGKTLVITVIAVVVRPDHVMKSWTWKDVRMQAGDIRSIAIPKEFEMKLAGTYKVDLNVYSRDMMPLHRLSKTFVAVDPAHPSAMIPTPAESIPSSKEAPVRGAGSTAEYRSFGLGLYANALNSSIGATMLLWPSKHVGVQASYTVGSFTIAEGRILARYPLSSGISPYAGIGYLDVTTERQVENIGIKASFQDSALSGVLGVEVPLGTRIIGSVELSGASIDLKKEVTIEGLTGTASVKYSPVTIGISIVYYMF